MDEQTIGLIFAIIGVVATVGYLVLAIMGINLLKEIRDRLNSNDKA